MKKENRLIEEFKNNLHKIFPHENLKLKINSEQSKPEIDCLVILSYQNANIEYWGEIIINESFLAFQKKINQLKSLIKGSKKIQPLVLSYYLSAERQEYCKKNKVYFIDLAGNIYIEYKSILIDKSGYQNRYPERRLGRSPFSDKASLILRELFNNRNKYYGVREIAEQIGLDPGFVSRIAKALEERNYISRKDAKLKMIEMQSILDDWVNDYNYQKNQFQSYYMLAESPSEILNEIQNNSNISELKYALSLQAGANVLLPFSVYKEVHLYVEDFEAINVFVNELNLKKSERGANINFMMPYYKKSVFFEQQFSDNLWIVSDLQLYLDLYKYPQRGIEQAEKILNERIVKSGFNR